MKRFILPLALAWAALLTACGGSDGPAPAPADPVIGIAAPVFYRSSGQVQVGEIVSATAAVAPGCTPVWRLASEPSTVQPAVLAPQAGGGVAFFVSHTGDYRLELVADCAGVRSAPVYSTLTAIPTQIEYITEVGHNAGITTVVVRGTDASPQMAGCMVRAAGRCVAPTAVEAWLDGVLLGRLTAPNATATVAGRGAQPAYNFTTSTLSLGSATHGLRVVVQADAVAETTAVSGRSRETYLVFSAAAAALEGNIATYTADVAYSIAMEPTLRIGGTATVAASATGKQAPLVQSLFFRLVDKPEGSNAQLMLDGAAPPRLVPDRVGRYTVESRPVFADARIQAPATYATILVLPHELQLTAYVENTPRPADFPVAAADVVRVTAKVSSDANIAAVEAFLDGVSLGRLTQHNVIRREGFDGRVTTFFTVYAWDINRAQLGAGAHTVRIVATDARGLTGTGTVGLTAGVDGQATFGPFTDPNP